MLIKDALIIILDYQKKKAPAADVDTTVIGLSYIDGAEKDQSLDVLIPCSATSTLMQKLEILNRHIHTVVNLTNIRFSKIIITRNEFTLDDVRAHFDPKPYSSVDVIHSFGFNNYSFVFYDLLIFLAFIKAPHFIRVHGSEIDDLDPAVLKNALLSFSFMSNIEWLEYEKYSDSY